MSVRILIGTIVAMALLLNGCGQSKDEKVKIAAVTCAIMAESRNMDASIRVEKINEARDKIGGEPFLDGDDVIKEAFEYGLCQELVLNETYDDSLQALKEMPRVKEEFYTNGQLKERTNYQPINDGGKEHGLFEAYHENGQLRLKRNYKDGERHGLSESYYENGQLQNIQNLKDGKWHGLEEMYYENGQLRLKRNYKDGERHGLSESYHENGQLRNKGTYQNGKRHGFARVHTVHGGREFYAYGCYQNGEEVDMSNCE
jgi:antitoxin component YwqK of YwqJK toxin-antitoxin module